MDDISVDTALRCIALLMATGSHARQPGEPEDAWAKRVGGTVEHVTRIAATIPPTENATPLTPASLLVAVAHMVSPGVDGETAQARTTRMVGMAAHLARVAAAATSEPSSAAGHPKPPREKHRHYPYPTAILGVEPVIRQSRSKQGVSMKKACVHLKAHKRDTDTAYTDITGWVLADGSRILDPVAGELARRCQTLVGHRVLAYVVYEIGSDGTNGGFSRNKVLVDVIDCGLMRSDPSAPGSPGHAAQQ